MLHRIIKAISPDDDSTCPGCGKSKSPRYDLCKSCDSGELNIGDWRGWPEDALTFGWWVYVLQIVDGDERYVGTTNDLFSRLEEHANGMTTSTKGRRWRLVYFEHMAQVGYEEEGILGNWNSVDLTSRRTALAREAELKAFEKQAPWIIENMIDEFAGVRDALRMPELSPENVEILLRYLDTKRQSSEQ